MTVPVLTTEVMFTSPTWTDISPYVRSANVKRGSSRVDSPILRYEAGTAQVVLDNRDRRFDPTNLTGPYTTGGVITGDTGIVQFKCTNSQQFGTGLTLDVKSASGQTAEVVNVTSRASGTTGSFTVPKPAGTLSGHKMIVIHFADTGDTTDMGISGGASWGTNLGSSTSGTDTINCRVWHKTAGGSEPLNYTLTQDTFSDGVAVIITLRNTDNAALPILLFTNNDEKALYSTPSTTPAGPNDIEIRACGGNSWGLGGSSWTAKDTTLGYTEYADKQSAQFTTGAVFIKQLTGAVVTGTGTTRVLPMRPIRMRATWNFIATTNLIQNPSFELDTFGWTDLNGNGTIRTIDQFGYIGGDSLELSRFQTSGSGLYGVTCNAVGSGGATIGQTVTVSAYVYVPAASYSKITGYSIAAVGMTAASVTGPPAADTWFRVTRTAVLTGTLDDVSIRFTTDDTHGDGQVIAYIDGVQAEVRSSASPYADGDQPGCSWTSTAHASNSTRPASVTFPLFRGFIDEWGVEWQADVDSEVTVDCTDGFKVIGANDRAALGSPVGANELSGARVTRILNSVDWPIGERNIATGIGQMQGTTLDGSGLTELFLVADSEIGEFYMDAAGIATFRGRTGIFSDTRSTNPQVRFGDGGTGAGELMYHDVVISYDDVQLYNEARIARTGGSQQTASDAPSIADFLTHTFERTDLLLVSDAESLSYAQWIVYISKDPELRFDQLIIRPQKDEDNLFPQILDREIGDRIKITRRPPGGGDPVIREVFIRGMELNIEQYFWEMTYNLQSATKVGNFLTLDHPTLGRIGQNALRF